MRGVCSTRASLFVPSIFKGVFCVDKRLREHYSRCAPSIFVIHSFLASFSIFPYSTVLSFSSFAFFPSCPSTLSALLAFARFFAKRIQTRHSSRVSCTGAQAQNTHDPVNARVNSINWPGSAPICIYRRPPTERRNRRAGN